MKRQNYLIKLIIILIAVQFLNINNLYCQIIKTISVEFLRESEEETVKGKIFYQANKNKVSIKVNNPVNQWMILQGHETKIYYPDKLQAFIIFSRNPVHMPFFQAFVGVIKEDYGLTEAKFTLSNYKKDNNLLTLYWSPPKNLSNLLGEIILKYKDNKIIKVESKDAKGKTISKIIFNNHIKFANIYFPLEVNITKFQKTGTISEKIIYENPKFNIIIPKEISAFKIPPEATVKRVVW